MDSKVIRLFPPDGKAVQHKNLYLRQDLRSQQSHDGSAFVYANFIVSLDGRIAVPDPNGKGVTLATQITNDRDWRLFQELAVQADVLITSGRYLREYAKSPKQELLQVYEDPKFTDLAQWRRERGLKEYPAVAVISRSLDFDVPAPLREPERGLYIFTTENADSDRKLALAGQGAEIVIAGEQDVSGQALISGLQENGCRLIYSTAGPKIFHLLVTAGFLDRIYLTITQRMLGGEPFATIMEGSQLSPPADFTLRSLFFDPQAPADVGQYYAAFDRSGATGH